MKTRRSGELYADQRAKRQRKPQSWLQEASDRLPSLAFGGPLQSPKRPPVQKQHKQLPGSRRASSSSSPGSRAGSSAQLPALGPAEQQGAAHAAAAAAAAVAAGAWAHHPALQRLPEQAAALAGGGGGGLAPLGAPAVAAAQPGLLGGAQGAHLAPPPALFPAALAGGAPVLQLDQHLHPPPHEHAAGAQAAPTAMPVARVVARKSFARKSYALPGPESAPGQAGHAHPGAGGSPFKLAGDTSDDYQPSQEEPPSSEDIQSEVDQPAGRRRPAGALGHRRRSGAPAAGAPPAQRRRAPAGHRLPLLSSPVHRGGAGAARHPAAAAGSASNASSGASASAKRCWPDDPFLAARAAQQAAAAAATARGPPSSALCASPSMSDENALLEAVVGPGCALHAADSGAWDLAFQDACCPLPGPGAGDMHGDGGAWEAAHCAAPHHPLSPGSEADDDCLPQEELGGIMADALAGAQGCDGAAGGAGAGGRMVHGLGSLAALDSLLTQEQQQEQEWALAGDIFGCAVAPRGAPASAGSGGGPLGRGGLFGSPVKAPPALSLSPSPGPGLGGAAAAAAGLDGSTPPEAGEAVQAAARKLQLPSVVGHDSDSDGPCTTGLQLSAFWAPPEAGRRDSADGVAGGGAALRTTGSLDSSHLVTLADLGGAAAPAVVAGSGPVAAGAGRLVDVGKLEAPELRSLLASTMQEVAALREQLAGSQQEAEQWRAQAQRQEAAVSGIRRQLSTGALASAVAPSAPAAPLPPLPKPVARVAAAASLAALQQAAGGEAPAVGGVMEGATDAARQLLRHLVLAPAGVAAHTPA